MIADGGLLSHHRASFAVAALAVACGPEDHPEDVDRALAQLGGVHTAYAALARGVLQVDVDREVVTWDREGTRIHWDGADLYVDGDVAAGLGGRVRELWDEWRAGFPRTRFVAVAPVPGRAGPTRASYRVELPFDWARPYLVVVSTRDAPNGPAALAVTVRDLASGAPLPLGTARPAPGCEGDRRPETVFAQDLPLLPRPDATDVPLAPETYSRHRPREAPPEPGWTPEPRSGWRQARPAWHDARQFVPLDAQVRPTPALTATQRCPSRETASERDQLVLRVPADRSELTRLAAQECAPVLEAILVAHGTPPPDQCATIAWRAVVRGEPARVLRTGTAEVCGGARGDARIRAELPPGLDPAAVELHLDREVRAACGPKSDEWSRLTTSLTTARITWWGCYPGWDLADR